MVTVTLTADVVLHFLYPVPTAIVAVVESADQGRTTVLSFSVVLLLDWAIEKVNLPLPSLLYPSLIASWLFLNWCDQERRGLLSIVCCILVPGCSGQGEEVIFLLLFVLIAAVKERKPLSLFLCRPSPQTWRRRENECVLLSLPHSH